MQDELTTHCLRVQHELRMANISRWCTCCGRVLPARWWDRVGRILDGLCHRCHTRLREDMVSLTDVDVRVACWSPRKHAGQHDVVEGATIRHVRCHLCGRGVIVDSASGEPLERYDFIPRVRR